MKCTITTIAILFSLALIAQNNTAKKIDDYLTRTVDYGFSGAVIVSQDGEVILNKGYGLAHRETGKPNTKSSVFSTGSVTKQFTAAGIMKLEMMGKLNVKDKVSKYFNNTPNDKKDISIHNLLSHTSGLPLALSEDDFEQISKDDYLKKAMASELEFNPGEDMNYSNIGYSLLAMIIEKQSGMSYEEFLKKHLFDPAGMKQTGYALPDWNKTNFVSIYRGDKNNGTSERFTKPTWHLIGNGGILSSTTDMIKWVQALSGEAILSKKVKKKMFTPNINEYGYGWDVIDDGALRQHDGGSFLGLSAELRWFVEDDIITVVFSNASINGNAAFTVIRDDLEGLTMGDEIPLPPKVSIVKEDTEAFVGAYQLPSGQQFTINENSGTIALVIDNQELLDLISDPKNYSSNSPAMALNNKFRKAFSKAFKEGDYSEFSFTGAQDELKKEIQNEIKMEGLENPHFKVVKSYRSKRDKNMFITQIALSEDPNFNDESMLLSIVTENSEYAGLGVDFGFAGPVELTLYPIGKNKFQAYSLSNKMGAKIEITKADGDCTFNVEGTIIENIKKIK